MEQKYEDYVWSSKFEIGDQKIDDQHKGLVATMNSLLHALQTGGHRTEAQGTLSHLLEYTVEHFASEEELQRKINYPDYARHKKIHDDFKETAVALAGQAEKELKEKGKLSIALIAKVHDGIGDWVVSHILGEDLKLVPYIQKHKQA